MTEEKKITALVVHKPSTLFPQWDEKLASMHVHIEFLNKTTGKDFKECPIDEETIVMAVVTDIVDSRQAGVHGPLKSDSGYIFDAMLEYFYIQYPIPDSTDATTREAIIANITAMTRYYTEMYTLLIERLSKAPVMLGYEFEENDNWAVEIIEQSDSYILTIDTTRSVSVC